MRQRTDEVRQRLDERRQQATEVAQEAWRNPRLTFRRLSGLDRSGPPPPATLTGAPWHVWTVPNAIGFVRLILIPVMLWFGLRDDGDRHEVAAVLFAVIAGSDYLDGMAARITGQYSRLGALLDPFVDRLLVLAGLVVCWQFELLPRWALLLVALREIYVMAAAEMVLRRGVSLSINWLGRLGVWPTMSAIFFALLGFETVGLVLLLAGLALGIGAAAQYTIAARIAIAEKPSSRT